MKLFNSLNRKLEDLQLNKSVGVYTCGPTVYSYVTIGNWRTYTLGDLIVRTLRKNGHDVNYVMNITDVGHLTGDNFGDADTGDDRLEKAATKEGKTAWEIAAHYTNNFLYWYEKMNLVQPEVFCKATDHIEEQIELVKKLEQRGLTYVIDDGVYFDVVKYEVLGFDYGELSTLDQIQIGARVAVNENKRDGRDFALWKFSKDSEKRHMEWDSPWGRGFPGWHIECSAMSCKYLGEQFDIHIGGEDLRSTHHPNEIAQSQGASGINPFVKYWIHGAFLQVDGGRMGKSLGNAYRLEDILERGFSPLDLRYFYLSGHYRQKLNFSWEGLEGARNARRNLINRIEKLVESKQELMSDNMKELEEWDKRFMEKLNDDLNMPEVLALVWELVKSEVSSNIKYELLIKRWDQVLGLNLDQIMPIKLSEEIVNLVNQRDEARSQKDWQKSDQIRDKLLEMGYEVEDTSEGTKVRQK